MTQHSAPQEPGGRPRVHWRVVFLASYVIVNLAFIPTKIVLDPDVPVDWQVFRALPDAIASETIYDIAPNGVPFVWSPVAAWLLAGATLLGYWPWLALHVASVFLLRRPMLIALVLVSYGFWFDAAQGNTVSFALIAGMLGVQGSRWGSVGYLALLLLMPRPLMLPLAAWLLWRERWLWLPFAGMFVGHAALVLASGLTVPWLEAMLSYDLAPGITIGPTALIGRWWLLAGIPLGLWLTWRGYVGWAGLAVSPYITPQYVVWPLMDLAEPIEGRSVRRRAQAQLSSREGPRSSRPSSVAGP